MATALPTAATGGKPLDMDLGQSDEQQIAARTTVLYGDSGLGKSTNARFFAQYIYELTGLPSVLVAFEDSSKVVFEPLIELGIVRPVWMTKAQYPMTSLRMLAKGKLPSVKGDKVEWDAIKPHQYGGYIIEGLSSGAESLLEFVRENHLFLREQKADAVEIGGIKVSAASQSAYGVVQSEMVSALKGFGMLPVERVLWTAHESKGMEDSAIIRGPGVVGSAATAKVQKYCGLLLHVDGVKDAKGVMRPRIYFNRHPDPVNPAITYPAKTTVPVERINDLLTTFPGGYFDPGVEYGTGIDKFLRVERELVAQQTTNIADWKAKLDGARK